MTRAFPSVALTAILWLYSCSHTGRTTNCAHLEGCWLLTEKYTAALHTDTDEWESETVYFGPTSIRICFGADDTGLFVDQDTTYTFRYCFVAPAKLVFRMGGQSVDRTAAFEVLTDDRLAMYRAGTGIGQNGDSIRWDKRYTFRRIR